LSNQIKNNEEYDLVVIGAGSGGVRAARIAANYGAKVAILENVKVGGTCVLRGCVPKKLLVYGSHVSQDIKSAEGYGWSFEGVSHDWRGLIKAKNNELDRLNKVYLGLLEKVDIFNGFGTLSNKNQVLVNNNILKAKNILFAVGGKPFMPEIPGIELCINSDQALDLKSIPNKLIINGGGYIALEFAGIFSALGSEVTLIYRGKNILRGFDTDISKLIREEYKKQNIQIFTETEITKIKKVNTNLEVSLTNGNYIESNQVLMATGRLPNTKGLNLTKIGIKTGSTGEIIVNEENRTNIDNIFAIGDVTNKINLTPVAIAEGNALADNLFGGKKRLIDYNNIPSAVFSQPAIGVVGLNEDQAIKKYKDLGGIKVYKTSFKPMKETLGKKDTKIFIKMIVSKSTDKVLGIHGIGDDMPEIIQICALAIKLGATKSDFDDTMGIHPTVAEELVTLR
tara:strand:- start:3891 stop:5249 length:1359 start_codon:yes stop_codon:yes gene_type:complete